MKILGKTLANNIIKRSQDDIAELKKFEKSVTLGVIFIGNDPSSEAYIGKKRQLCEKLGINFLLFRFEESITKDQLISNIKNIQEDEQQIDGLIIQLPIPDHLYSQEVLDTINPDIDVDCLTTENLGSLVTGAPRFIPPTPAAVLTALESLDIDLAGKQFAIVGVGSLVGKPLAIILMNKRASVTTINSITKNVKEKCLSADIIVTGVGNKGFIIGKQHVHNDSIIIDTGIWFDSDGKMHGDVHVHEIEEIVHAVTPTPGGIGPLTVAHLIANTVQSAKKKK